MSSVARNQTREAFNELASNIRTYSGWFIVLGVLQVLAGMVALSFCFSATIASVALLGYMLLLASGAQIAAAIMARSGKGFFLFSLVGIVYGVTGVLTLTHPIAAAESLTLIVAATLVVGGTFRIAVSLVERFPPWGWVLFNGSMSVFLGVLVAAQWPFSGLWVIGALVGIDLIVNGVTWIALATEARTIMAPTAKVQTAL